MAAATILGFAVPAIFSARLGLPRDWFVAVYWLAVGFLLLGYTRGSGLDIARFLSRRWLWGVAGAVIVGAILVLGVRRMDPSPAAEGVALAWDLLWLGIVYGAVDALLLTVLPVASVLRAFATGGWAEHWPGRLASWLAAGAASLGVTAAYHLGHVEFRGPQVAEPLVGNAIVTLGYLLAGNPFAAIGAHVVLHIASVFHGVDTTVTLPPHP